MVEASAAGSPGLIHRVLQVHTRYRRRGGEDVVIEQERALLEGAGVEVQQVLFDNDDLDDRGLAARVRTAASAVWSRSAADLVRRAVDRHRSEIVHVHNTFLAASPSVYPAARRRGAAVVQTLHNYRFACPAGTAFRDGAPCVECVGRLMPWPAVVHGSYRGSRAQSTVAAAAVVAPRILGVVRRDIDAYIALTGFQRSLLVRGGLPADRVHLVPNFLEPDPGLGKGTRRGVLYVGRLDVEKGVAALLEAARRVPGVVRIIGDGPLRAAVERAGASAAVEYLGPRSHEQVLDELRRATALVVPSIWFEGFPMVIVEAYAGGTPVVASRIGGLPELVDDGVSGLLAGPGDAPDLARCIDVMAGEPGRSAAMGAASRRRYVDRYRGHGHLASLLAVYAAARTRRSTLE